MQLQADAAPYLFALFQIIPPRKIIPINAASVSVKRNACNDIFYTQCKKNCKHCEAKTRVSCPSLKGAICRIGINIFLIEVLCEKCTGIYHEI